ncbi:hypothetical protein EI94DRAFT_1721292, partial [Lactarius quietus]
MQQIRPLSPEGYVRLDKSWSLFPSRRYYQAPYCTPTSRNRCCVVDRTLSLHHPIICGKSLAEHLAGYLSFWSNRKGCIRSAMYSNHTLHS